MAGKTLLNVSNEYLYFKGEEPRRIDEMHSPYFLAFTQGGKQLEAERKKLERTLASLGCAGAEVAGSYGCVDSQVATAAKIAGTTDGMAGTAGRTAGVRDWGNEGREPLLNIIRLGPMETYSSFTSPGLKRDVFKVYTGKPYQVPEVSDRLFGMGFYTAEHDIPYLQRVAVDIAAERDMWPLDTHGKKETLDVFTYDIETTEYKEGKENNPIDIIGYSEFSVCFQSSKNLDTEEFDFEILDCPSDWGEREVIQLVARNIDEEIDNLARFCTEAKKRDVIAGHNILSFDNKQIYDRMSWILKEKASLSPSTLGTFNEFLAKYAKASRSFHFGSAQDVVYIHPMSFDTFHAARRFYSFLDDFSLKALAPFLGINIDERVYLTPSQMALDDRTLEYNKHDVQEQLGVTMRLIQQALPLAFTTGMQMEELMTSGAVKMWDHMSLIRAAKHRRIMPAMARALSIAQTVHHRFGDGLKRREIADFARNTSSPDEPDKHMKEFARVAKYGEEMPEYVEYPLVVFNPQGGDSDEMLGYHIPGGMTLKPDTELDSDFIPWYHVVVADVGAMYPTILRARNVGGDSVRLAGPNEEPDDWIWLKRLPASFLESNVCRWREVGETDRFADVGYMLGVKISKEPGVVNLAMSAIIKMIGKIKRELKEAEVRHADRESLGRLKMSYQSLKGARNAGTHGIMAAATVSCRQFNVWGAAMITTTGQAILDDTLKELQDRKIRVVYGDTDGIYVACSKSMHDVGGLARAVGIEPDPEKSSWMTLPENAVAAIDFCNDKWRRELDYSDFELEPEEHGAMIFVKHKNYLIFDEKKGEFAMTTKGNNFKGSDKAELARIVLEEIMRKVLLENSSWESEESARRCVKASIKRITRDAVAALDMSKVNLADLTLVQSVQPSKRYKTNQDGALSTFAERTKALEELLGRQITATARFKFVVTKKPLPGIRNPSKSGVKPIDYMYPVELLTNRGEIDLAWYKNMVENYVKGAFGLPDLSASVQKGLSEWF